LPLYECMSLCQAPERRHACHAVYWCVLFYCSISHPAVEQTTASVSGGTEVTRRNRPGGASLLTQLGGPWYRRKLPQWDLQD